MPLTVTSIRATRIDLFSERVRRNPYPAYEEVRRAGPAVYDWRTRTWYVGRYRDVQHVLREHESFSNERTGVESTLLGADGALHERSRSIVQPAFSLERIASLKEPLRSLSGELSADVVAREACDLVEDFAMLVPMTGIAWMLGMDTTRVRDLRRWSAAIIRSTSERRATRKTGAGPADFRRYLVGLVGKIDSRLRPSTSRASTDLEECRAFLVEHFDQARLKRTGGWLTDALAEQRGNDGLTTEELMDIAFLLIVAGTETTTDLIVNSALFLACNPDVQDEVRGNPELLNAFLEEVLRFDSPVQRRPRIAARRVTIGSVEIPAGARIEVLLGSANRDPEKFADADRFRLDRRPNRHLTFGVGRHFCLGAELARIEAHAALEALAQRCPKMTLACSIGQLEYPTNLRRRGPLRLPIKFG
jgi:cytochrome P450